MNSESCRKDLDSKLASKGYIHPTSSNSSNNPYMAYSEEKKGDYFSQHFDPYATFNTEEVIKDIQKSDFCPACNTKAMYSCNCELSDMMCKNGHIWFVQKNGSVKLGDPHENE